MGLWNVLPVLPLLLSSAVAVIIARSLCRSRPTWSKARLAIVSSLPGAFSVLLLGGFLLTRVGPASPDEIDSGGMIIAGLMTLTPLYALLVLTVGALSARMALRPRRR
jgi:hypothetical protein